MTLDEKIAQAQRHVDSGRLIIARQRELVIRYRGLHLIFSKASSEHSRYSRWIWPTYSNGDYGCRPRKRYCDRGRRNAAGLLPLVQ
jgi:hypothetical protein